MIDDMLDDSLCAVMKGRCTDATRREAPRDAAWEPAPRAPTDLDRVKLAVMAMAPYTALMAIVFWWQQSGRLDSTTGFWALIVLALLAGICMGRAGRKKEV